ncbi:MAG TPA: SEC-C domain-containing protein [Candidatus Acidoferrales bacterium]|nr:SEC-C domain-containing protein [Candidatus Acidoferrales bacterium]
MSFIGRNDPCPCGSGLKFKKCCLNKAAAAERSYSPAERDSALAKLMRFCHREEFDRAHESALEIFWGDWLGEEPDEELREVMESEQVDLAYHSWFAFDFDLGGGKRPLDLFLQREAGRLGPGERNFLEGMRESHLRLYEVLEVKPDLGFELRDLWDNRRLWVKERLGTRRIVRWDLIVGRIGSAGEEAVFEVLPYLFPAADKDDFVSGLKKSHQLFARERPQASLVDFFRSMAPVFHQLWLERVALKPLPRIMTAEGDPFVFARVMFDVRDRERAVETLASSRELVARENGNYGWVEETGPVLRSLGTVVLERDRLVLETTSRQRAERGKDFVQGLLGDAVRFRAVSYEDVWQAVKHAPEATKRPEPEIPPGVQAEIVGRFYEKHYREWVNTRLPALGNRTPRQASRLKSVRPKLIALLKNMESMEERKRRAGEAAYDFGWMWEELGLERE